jgi:NAD(P)-dependent dehydrogenase (short-subunit alcohol dehydrogenase family)
MPQPDSPTALITGAAGGIGRALVATFQAAGYRVIATDRIPKPPDLSATQYLQADLAALVADADLAERLLGPVRQQLAAQGLNVLINNAALQILGDAQSLTRADWRATLDVNLLAPFFLTQALLPELEKARGCVLNIGSIHARLTKRRFAAYATSKAALGALTRALALDLGGRVRVLNLEPAAIATDMLTAGFAADPEGLARLARFHPSGEIGAPADLAHLALCLVQTNSPFFTGASIGFDGGIAGCLHDPG